MTPETARYIDDAVARLGSCRRPFCAALTTVPVPGFERRGAVPADTFGIPSSLPVYSGEQHGRRAVALTRG